MAQSKLDGLLTTREVADLFGVPTSHILRAIREGKLTAIKLGWQWVIDRQDLPDEWPPAA